MYLMVNEFGNVYKEVRNEREKNELLELNYKVVDATATEQKRQNAKTPKKKTNSKGVKKNDE